MRTFDAVVVGGGPDRRRSGRAASDRGMSVARVEDRLVGGEYGHWACIPSKALLRPPEVVVGEVPLERLRHAVPPFPTRSELWLSLLEQAGV